VAHPAGATRELFASERSGVITHIWFTIAADSGNHLKEIVIRIYWMARPSPAWKCGGRFVRVEPWTIFHLSGAFLNCSSVKGLNCYFAMPFRRSARITAPMKARTAWRLSIPTSTTRSCRAARRSALLPRAVSASCTESAVDQRLEAQRRRRQAEESRRKENYVFAETRGGPPDGVTLGVLQNQDYWMGEGDEMIFVTTRASR